MKQNRIPPKKNLAFGSIVIGTIFLAEYAGVKYAVAWLVSGLILCLTVLGFYAYYRKHIGNPVHGVKFHESVYIGATGEGLSLNIRRLGNTTVITNPFWQSVFIAGLSGFFGPGVVAAYFLFPEEFQSIKDLPLPFLILIPILILASTTAFLNTLKAHFVDKPSIEISREGVVLKKQGKEIVRIPKTDISRLSTEVTHFTAPRSAKRLSCVVYNYTLCVHRHDESVTKLCITDNKHQIDALTAEMGSLLQVSGYRIS